ncbi:MAG: hypothetical protein COW04_08485 [Deltaproteobacteria bacterium CG12_big_fil_rev_8_21_14_0_65_43_10]|nr:MAG: hypothetical protein COW04_08485 [Deltaproteobacteria bacterium CG12_big_fil_rev_8_21_14_0_65_43_10]PIU86475.1 MAG: hypothetical protein COS67_02195 [Deltaproteobacteria bacterium CG06_land_8_20_14_3_00_44_19]PIX23659.1 MAG: hypothetical protein COZ68_08840 [Deltaproteobacteria bacterium CG_4_8_14_3_um_filter_43_13]PJB45396.1 MAG: hypothetical protein CO106_01775 [Deltaproteobacteria bacterium CG_4_9_14_3_um_filter_44_9]
MIDTERPATADNTAYLTPLRSAQIPLRGTSDTLNRRKNKRCIILIERTMEIEAISRGEINSIKILWENLNDHHLSKSMYFKDHFSKFTFEKRMEALVKRDRFIAYVAQDSCDSVGYCIATVDGSIGEIDSLFVKGAYRGQGVGEKLVTLALKWLEEQDCETIRVSIAEGNEQVLDFYRKFGFAERLIVMQKTHNIAVAGNGGKACCP